MSNYEQESLSALMDGEADELELRRLLKALDKDPELAQRWQRYHLAQSILHDRGVPVGEDFAQRVANAIEDEPLPARSTGMPHWQQQLTRVAIAACVAIVAVVALQPGSDPDQPLVAAQNGAETEMLSDSTADNMIADAPATEVGPQVTEYFQEFFDAMRFDPEEPVRTEHLQDSPLYRLVNDYQTSPTP